MLEKRVESHKLKIVQYYKVYSLRKSSKEYTLKCPLNNLYGGKIKENLLSHAFYVKHAM